jgi:hypothetical protein
VKKRKSSYLQPGVGVFSETAAAYGTSFWTTPTGDEVEVTHVIAEHDVEAFRRAYPDMVYHAPVCDRVASRQGRTPLARLDEKADVAGM